MLSHNHFSKYYISETKKANEVHWDLILQNMKVHEDSESENKSQFWEAQE